MLAWMRRSMGGSRPGGGAHPGLGAVLGVMNEVFNPAAARAKQALDNQHERVLPSPTPGDRLLQEGRIVIEARRAEDT